MDNFDLKRFLVENKMTRNSILLSEQPEMEGIPEDDPLAQIPEVPAETPSEPSGEIDKETAKELIFNTKGKFFTVVFIKKNGSSRTMNARLNVRKYLRGGTLAYDPAEFNYITVYDMGAKGYRMVNANTIKNLKIGKNEYLIPDAISEARIVPLRNNEPGRLITTDNIEEFGRYIPAEQTFVVEIDDSLSSFMNKHFSGWVDDDAVANEGYKRWKEGIKQSALEMWGPDTIVEFY